MKGLAINQAARCSLQRPKPKLLPVTACASVSSGNLMYTPPFPHLSWYRTPQAPLGPLWERCNLNAMWLQKRRKGRCKMPKLGKKLVELNLGQERSWWLGDSWSIRTNLLNSTLLSPPHSGSSIRRRGSSRRRKSRPFENTEAGGRGLASLVTDTLRLEREVSPVDE